MTICQKSVYNSKAVSDKLTGNGILAQLGEHLPYKQRVTGSSPVGPIFLWKTSVRSRRFFDVFFSILLLYFLLGIYSYLMFPMPTKISFYGMDFSLSFSICPKQVKISVFPVCFWTYTNQGIRIYPIFFVQKILS